MGALLRSLPKTGRTIVAAIRLSRVLGTKALQEGNHVVGVQDTVLIEVGEDKLVKTKRAKLLDANLRASSQRTAGRIRAARVLVRFEEVDLDKRVIGNVDDAVTVEIRMRAALPVIVFAGFRVGRRILM